MERKGQKRYAKKRMPMSPKNLRKKRKSPSRRRNPAKKSPYSST